MLWWFSGVGKDLVRVETLAPREGLEGAGRRAVAGA